MKPHTLIDIREIKLQEGLIIKDLLCVLLAQEGSYVRYNERYNPQDPVARLNGADYKINKHLDSSLKDVTKRMVVISKMYSALVYFTETFDSEEYGQVTQTLVQEVRNVLKEYIRFLNQQESRFKYDKSFTLRQFEQNLKSQMSYKISLLYDIILTIYQFNQERQQEVANQELQFNNFITSIKNDLDNEFSLDILVDGTKYSIAKGGQILRIIQDIVESHNGDTKASEFLVGLFNNVSVSYIHTLNNWLTLGELDDVSNEFFISSGSSSTEILYTENFWHNLFIIKVDGLPKQFLDRNVQVKILLTGKYLNILKSCGVVLAPYNGSLVSTLNGNNLFLVLEETYRVANEQIISLFMKGYQFESIVSQMNYFFLLNKADKFYDFVLSNVDDFKRSYQKTSLAKIKRSFENTFDSTAIYQDLISSLLSLQIEDSSIYDYLIEVAKQEAVDAASALATTDFESFQNIMSKSKELKVNSSSSESKDAESTSAINYINLEIIMPFPLNLVLTRTVVTEYQFLFRHLMNLQYTDKLINESWDEINKHKIWKYKGFDSTVSSWIRRARASHNSMKDFYKTYSDYLYSEVISVNMAGLDFSKLNNFSDFERALNNSLMGNLKSAGLTNEELTQILCKTLEIVNGFCKFLTTLRKVLILLNQDLFHKYSERMKTTVFNVEQNYERIEKLNTYLNSYQESFKEHVAVFIRTCHQSGVSDSLELKNLAVKLEASFPTPT
ncbi:hypothetical protein WICPIJ_000452 [Wickerhamomyces pijperi]|uniref:Spindle pole body component n=1 Tax=Wickerhamomyces pijperi TaxID=599730 RepID=A0A9P8QDR4_WICPI|nr:hypothetical protein WICPIJ_000452 [Wickerhamomyces pijperi]